MKKLSKEQMKMVVGGDHSQCYIEGGGSYHCTGTLSDCQTSANTLCSASDDCSKIECKTILA